MYKTAGLFCVFAGGRLDALDEIFDKYTVSSKLDQIKNKDFGALFELCYIINLKEDANKKEFIDEMRCRNGNLNIVLTLSVSEGKSSGKK